MNYLFTELDCLEGTLKILFLQIFNLLSPAISKTKWLLQESVRCPPSQCLLTWDPPSTGPLPGPLPPTFLGQTGLLRLYVRTGCKQRRDPQFLRFNFPSLI